jgi:hypothetical protein
MTAPEAAQRGTLGVAVADLPGDLQAFGVQLNGPPIVADGIVRHEALHDRVG